MEKNNYVGVTFHNIVHFGVPSLVTDHNFFSFFGFPLKEGDIETVFSRTNNAIITESAARKYFPDEDPIGQRIVLHGYDSFISGIMDALAPYQVRGFFTQRYF